MIKPQLSSLSRSILFVGGGTAGHINPLLAVLAAVQKMDPSAVCHYVGLSGDLQSASIQSFPLSFYKYSIHSGKLNRFLTWKHFGQAFWFAVGLVEANRLVKRIRPAVVFAKGGYVSLPIVIAASRQHIPIYCHETDVRPGLVNRLIAKRAKQIFTAFPVENYPQFPADKLLYCGQPVRGEFYQPTTPPIFLEGKEILLDRPLLTVIGGSQGARRLNELVQTGWMELLERVSLVHICGNRDWLDLKQKKEQLPASLRERLYLAPYIQDQLPAIFQHSQLIISRAGGTMAELAAVAKPTILLPLSSAAQNHQVANAQMFAQKEAVLVLDENQIKASDLLETIWKIIDSPLLQTKMKKAIAQFDQPQAAEKMARVLLS
jgi:UDP-N-acetylglucosamine--N-acetylmuramyl-(pentapeptide) pyrophosphoryl-undecaprenol N-acetylglucosamine transferase